MTEPFILSQRSIFTMLCKISFVSVCDLDRYPDNKVAILTGQETYY